MSSSRKSVSIYCITYLFLFALLSSISTASDSALQIGDSVPRIEAVSIEGIPLTFHPPKKKYNILLVSFLNVNDGNYEEYLKDLIVLYRRFHGYGLHMVSVYSKVNEDYIMSMADKWTIPWSQVLDTEIEPKRPFQIFGIEKTPANVLIGQAGKVLGVNLKGDEAHTAIGKLLNVAMSHVPMPEEPVPYANRQKPDPVAAVPVTSGEKTQQDILGEYNLVSSFPLNVAYFQRADSGIRPTLQVLQKNGSATTGCGWHQDGKEHDIFGEFDEPTNKRIFRPGSQKFGVFITAVFQGNHKWSTDPEQNPGKESHARVYELKPEKPTNLPAYLITWEDMPLGPQYNDFQDIVLRLDGVKPYYSGNSTGASSSEKEVIKAIEQYGGFIQYDKEGHVEEVNLVYHEDDLGNRIECNNTSDTIMELMPALPNLKRLLIHSKQATDRVMPFMGKLTELEQLYMWGPSVTDAGISHLTGLKNLTYIHCGQAKIGDLSFKYLSQLPKLEGMSLQQNNFSDEGLKYLQDMVQLKKLFVGIGTVKITDGGMQYLVNLKNLEMLDLQGTSVTDEGLKQLKVLTNLKTLWLDKADVTVEGVESLKKNLPDLKVQM